MSEEFGSGPKFPGDISDHLARADEPADRWADRFRTAWFTYAVLAISVPLWVSSIIAAIVYLHWYMAIRILTVPLTVYVYFLYWRLFTGRDLNTGERLYRRER